MNQNFRIAYAFTRGTRAAEGAQGGASAPRYRLNVFASIDNVVNRANYTGFSGVMFFMKPSAVANPRRVTMGLNATF